jgi:hypothetical protein
MENKQAKRRLKSFSFEKDGCHVSVVGPSLGSGANGRKTLVLKSLNPSGETKPSNGEGSTMEMIEKSVHDTLIKKAVEDAVAPFKAELEILKSAQVEQLQKSRKEKLAKVIGEAAVEETFMAIKSLDDAGFEIILKSLAAAKVAEGASLMFTEKGVSGQANVSEIVNGDKESIESKLLKAKFKVK